MRLPITAYRNLNGIINIVYTLSYMTITYMYDVCRQNMTRLKENPISIMQLKVCTCTNIIRKIQTDYN